MPRDSAVLRRICRCAAGRVSRETFERLVAFEADLSEVGRRGSIWSAPSTLSETLDSPYPGQRATGANRADARALARHWLRRRLSRRGHRAPGPHGKSRAPRIDLVESNRKKAAFLQTSLGAVRCAGARACAADRGCLWRCSQTGNRHGAGLGAVAGLCSTCPRRGLTDGARASFTKAGITERSQRKRSTRGRSIW